MRPLREALPAGRGIAVAFSGGGDSTALLHALATEAPAAPLRALHVHHGLQSEADAWADHCRRIAADLDVPCEVLTVDARPRGRESPEEAARRARYAALTVALHPGEVLATGHHADDQAETVLLQLLRGAGARGLSGMPAVRPLGAGWLARPLLEATAAELRERVIVAGLPWVEDPSNAAPDPERNFLRHEILPRLIQRRPGALGAMGRSARLVASAAEAEAERAEADRRALETSEGGLAVADLLRLPRERAGAALHRAATARGLPVPDANRTDRILTEVAAARADADPRVVWPGAQARRHRGAIFLLAPLPEPPPEQPWQPGEPLDLPAGRLTAERTMGEGVAASALTGTITVGPPVPGERLPGPGGRRRISELLRAAGIAPWWRPHWPVFRVGGEAVALAGIAVAPASAAAPGETGWLLAFRPGSSPAVYSADPG